MVDLLAIAVLDIAIRLDGGGNFVNRSLDNRIGRILCDNADREKAERHHNNQGKQYPLHMHSK
jgi:hypothetical protein